MNWFMIVFLAAGAYMMYFGATTIQKMRESLKTGKTKMAGKELLPSAARQEIDKNQNKTTFWFIWGWNGIRSTLALLVGVFLVIVSVLEILKGI